MPQETLVLKLAAAERQALRERLDAGAFEFRSAPHADFSVKGEGVVATLYTSGKLVIQGAEARTFALRYLQRDAEPGAQADKAKPDPALEVPTDRPVVGSDEAGKGDYFGPLVVCALRLPVDFRQRVIAGGVTDSKKLSDDKVRKLAPGLEHLFDFAIERLDPPAYNATYGEVGNLNPMLADLHARAIRRVAQDGDVVVVDRFANEKLVASRVEDLSIELMQFPRAEREPAVAAASVIARAAFLDALHELSEDSAIELRKGAGDPTDASAREFVALHGQDALERVAKLHFKNTEKLTGGVRHG